MTPFKSMPQKMPILRKNIFIFMWVHLYPYVLQISWPKPAIFCGAACSELKRHKIEEVKMMTVVHKCLHSLKDPMWSTTCGGLFTGRVSCWPGSSFRSSSHSARRESSPSGASSKQVSGLLPKILLLMGFNNIIQ